MKDEGKDKYWKTRLDPDVDVGMRALAEELGISYAEAGRELLRRGLALQVTPVVVRPLWADEDLRAVDELLKAAHHNYEAANKYREMFSEGATDDMVLRRDIGHAARNTYNDYLLFRALRDSLLGLSADEVTKLRNAIPALRKQVEDGDTLAESLVNMLLSLGFGGDDAR